MARKRCIPDSRLSTQLAKKALVGDDLRDFVNLKLFPYLQGGITLEL